MARRATSARIGTARTPTTAEAAFAESPNRRSRVLAYVVPSLTAGLVVASWFRPGRFFASGDVPPFERHASAAEAFSIWGHQLTSAGGPSYDIARLPEYAVAVAGDRSGLGPEAAQRLFFALLAAAVVAAAVFFAFAFVRNRVVAASVGLLAFFNAFILQHLPNVLTLWTVMVMALLGGLVLRSRRATDDDAGSVERLAARRGGPFALGVVSMSACYLALNPPLLVATILWTALSVVACGLLWGRGAFGRAMRLVGGALPWVLVLNLWWVVPFAMTLLGGASSFVAETSIGNWSWTHARNGLVNVVSLSGNWAWGSNDLFPFAEDLDRFPWGALRFSLPVLALSGLVFAPRARRQVVGLLALAVPLVVLAKGLHPPLGAVNRFLYDHVPAMYLFREPLGKFGPILLLLMLALAALALEGTFRSLPRPTPKSALTVAALSAALIYPVPLWTGDVIRDASGDFPSAHVALPQAWRDVAHHLDGSGRVGKVLVLPLDDFYMMPTTWGYYGADVIPRFLLERAAIQPLSEGYFGDRPAFRRLIDRTQQALIAHDVVEVPRLLDALGVSDVVLRKDIDRSFPGRSLLDPSRLAEGLEQTPGLVKQMSTGVADVYTRPADRPPFQLQLAEGKVRTASPETIDALVGSAPGAIVTGPTDVTSRSGYVLRAPDDNVTFTTPGGRHALKRNLVRGLALEMRTVGDPPTALEISDDAPVALDGRTVIETPGAALDLPPGGHWAATAGGRVVDLAGGQSKAVLKPGERVSVFDTSEGVVVPDAFSEVGDCHARDARSLDAVGIRSEPITEHGPGVRLQAREHVACVSLELPDPPSTEPSLHRVTFEFRTLAGRPARFCIFRSGPERCDAFRGLEATPQWSAYDEVVASDPGGGPMQLFLYADGDARSGETTVTEYRNIAVSRARSFDQWSVPAARPTTLDLGPGAHTVAVVAPTRPPAEPLSKVSNCHAADGRSLRALGIEARPIPDTPSVLRLQAREQVACVMLAVRAPSPESRYRVSLGHRTVSGRSPRLCLYQVGPDRCARMPPLSAGSGWRSYDEVVVPEPGTRSLQLFLYVDGAPERTTVDFRDVRVNPTLPFDVSVVPSVGHDPVSGSLTWRRTGAASYEVQVPAAASARTVVLTESFSTSWEAHATPALELEHFEANGYANAWTLPPGDAVMLKVRYGPNDVLAPLFVTSAVALGVGARSAVRTLARRVRGMVSSVARRVTRQTGPVPTRGDRVSRWRRRTTS